MNNIELAQSNLRQAEERLKHAKEALASGNCPYVMRQSQEAVELALKGALRLVGLEPPKWHDVGPILKKEKERFPEWFQKCIEELASVSRSLRREREPALYGDEETGVPPEELYARLDAEKALNDADKVLALVIKLFSNYFKQIY